MFGVTKKKFTPNNINKRLDELSGLNMPHGGIDVGDFIETNTSPKMLEILNNSLIQLLIHGIIPMNDAGVYHCDIKESNVLVQKETKEKERLLTRLIDWGLTMDYTRGNKIPRIICNRPFQYNLPFSIILFNKTFIKKYTKFLKKTKEVTYESVEGFAQKYILYWIEVRGPGHLKLINSNMKYLASSKRIKNENDNENNSEKEDLVITYNYAFYYITEYITKILYTFTKDRAFNLEQYFQVFISNVDIWGFVMIYIPFVKHLSNHYTKLSSIDKELFEKFTYIFHHFLFENATTTINTKELILELKQLNLLIDKSDITERNTSSSSSNRRKKNITQKIRKRSKTNTIKNFWE